ncbi:MULTISPECIES: hypothetical protein [Paraburkholderia]|uniref:hypothetical protein n=1 Tax=Paraburkholderia TaxID=1822464 RepID=UPI00224CE350|nr:MULTISPECIES: hypothetical protein [Paraburkholderia]MCX4177803.1 hypothetical protein [Paraburkholderia madseniana]MDQ6465790.1 hypothetical protein [Paraburkholderia madseniana]
MLHTIDAAVALAYPCKRPLLGNFDRLFLRVEIGKITLDVHFAVNVIVSRNANQSRVRKEFPKGEVRRRVYDPPTVPALHDYLLYLGKR